MAGKLTHKFRTQAMMEYGRQLNDEEFEFNSLLYFMNSYKNKQGRPHRFVPLTSQQLGNLLQGNPHFQNVGYNLWKFLDEEE